MSLTNLLAGKIVLVNGGTQGVGAAIARAAAEQGAEAIAITGRTTEAGETLAQELSDRGTATMFLRADMASVADARSTVTKAIKRFGRVDHVVCAAGLTTRGTMLDTDEELFDAHIAVNLRAPFFIMQEAITHLKDRNVGGSIVNIVTMSEHGGQPYLAPYVASKAGLAGLIRNAAHAHRWDRIRINGLNIGWTATAGEDAIQRRFHGADDGWLERASASQPMGKLGQPDEIADFVVFLLSGRSGVVTGSVIDWDQAVVGAHD